MISLKKIRNSTYRRNDRIFQKIYDKKILSKNISILKINIYSKIKTVLNLELACLMIYVLLRTKIPPNIVSIFGVFWVLLGALLINFENNILIYSGVLILFFKLVPDYADGQLASLKKQTTTIGHELDVWAGNIGTPIAMSGFFIYSIKNNPVGQLDLFYLIFLVTNIFSFADLRFYLSKFKKTYYDKFLKTHTQKMINNKFINITSSNFLLNAIKFFHFDGSSRYIDFLLLLLILELNFDIQILYVFPIIWSTTYTLAFFKSVYLSLMK